MSECNRPAELCGYWQAPHMVGEIPIMHYFASLRFNNVSAMISQPENLANVGKRIKCFGWQPVLEWWILS